MSETQLIRCQACGATNRVEPDKLAQGLQPVCGSCNAALTVDSTPVTVTDATFGELVERAELPVVVDMWAPWCGPCRMLAPILDQVAVEMAGRLRVAKLNVDENPDSAARFNARQIPLLVVFRAGREIDRVVGLMPKAALIARLEQAVAA